MSRTRGPVRADSIDPAGATAPLSYTFPAPAGAIWLGLPPAALATVGIAVSLTVGVLLAGAPTALAALILPVGIGLACWPIAGRTPTGWLLPLLAHAHTAARRAQGWTAPLASNMDGLTDAERGASAARSSANAHRAGTPGQSWPRVVLPPEAGGLLLADLTGPAADLPPVGALLDRRRGTATVVLDVVGTDRFGLLEPAAQDNQLARWGTCLAGLCADPRLVCVQWLTHTRPDTTPPPGPGALLPAPGDPGGDQPEPDRFALLRDYRALAHSASTRALSHQHLVALTLTAAELSRRRPPDRAAADHHRAALIEQVRDLTATLLVADLLPRLLSPGELSRTLRRLVDPTLPDLMPTGPVDPDADSASVARCDPGGDVETVPALGGVPLLARRLQPAVLSRSRRWTSCRTDDAVHRGFAVSGWPRLALPADWLGPVLYTAPPAGTSRTLSVHASPVRPEHAARRARAARTKARLDATDRARLGFTGTAADALADTDASDLESELVAGYRLTQLSALVMISAPDEGRLELAAQALRTLSVSHRLDLRPVHGQHHRALAACLPLGRLTPGGRP